MKVFYVSLIDPLLGCFLQVSAKTEKHVRVAVRMSRLNRLWCSVYDTPKDPFNPSPIIIPTTIEKLVESSWHEYLKAIEAAE